MAKKKIYKYSELKDGQSFVGRIEAVDWESGDFGEQLHIQIKPLDHEISGETGLYHEWFKYSERKQSKWGTLTKALEDLNVNFSGPESLVGKTFEWERKDIELGSFTAKDTLIPTELIGEEKAEYDFTELKEKLGNEGMTSTQIERWARRKGIPKAELNKFMKGLEESGVLKKEEDGTYTIE